jgi:rubrerythrin
MVSYVHMSLEQVIRLAIEREMTARELYLEALGMVQDELVQGLLRELAAQEEGHRRRLEALLAGGTLAASLTASRSPVQDLHLTDYLEEVPLDENADVQQVLIVSGKREAGSHALYRALAGAATDAEVANLFDYLAAQELEHKQRVERLYEDLFYREN